MNEIAKQIEAETKIIVEAGGKKYLAIDHDKPEKATEAEKQQFSGALLAQVEASNIEKKRERKEYLRMFGGEPRKNT